MDTARHPAGSCARTEEERWHGAKSKSKVAAGNGGVRGGGGDGGSGIRRTASVGGHDDAIVPTVIDLFLSRYPGCEIQLQEIHFSDPFGALRTGQVDVALVWRPVREPDLTEGPVLLTEGRVLAVGCGHPLARRASVSMEDLGDCVVPDPAGLPEYWVDALVPARTPAGRVIPRTGPRPTTFHETLTFVAAGECVCPVHEHVQRYYSHPGVVLLPIDDAPATEWALVRRSNDTSALVRTFTETAATVGARVLNREG